MRFSLSSKPLIGSILSPSEGCGAFVEFVGRVRNTNDGRAVLSLEYEAFDELAVQEGTRIITDAIARFSVEDAACEHRVGHLGLGDAAVRVEVAAAHRQEAFEACRWIVDEIKARVPIWKREHYADGSTEWLDPRASDAPSP
jgi:molybdopterin synthase catalytic subunit